MKTFSRNEITNKHGQYISYLSKQPGNNELEQCINFNKAMAAAGVKYIQYDLKGIDNKDIYCVVVYNNASAGVEVFNDQKEKIYQSEELYDESEAAVIELLTDDGIM